VIALLLASPARCQDEVGPALLDQLLDASLAGVDDGHLAALTELSTRVASTDPAGPAVRYWLARAQAERGQVDAARATLLDGIRTGSCPRCRELFEHLEIDRLAASPGALWTFDDAHHGVFLTGSSGAITLSVADDRSVLEWAPEPAPEADDRLVLGLREGMTAIGFVLRAARVPATIQVQAEDLAGRRFVTAGTFTVPADRWVTVQVEARDLEAVGAGAVLRPADLRRVELVAWGGTRGSGRAPAVWLDSLAVE
jgi:hypothetical protein